MSEHNFKVNLLIVVCILLQINCGGSGGSGNISDEILGSLSSSDEASDGFYYDVIELGTISSSKTIEMKAYPYGFDLIISLLIGENFESAVVVASADTGYLGVDESIIYSFEETSTAWIYVSSYTPGEIGDYDLSYDITDSFAIDEDVYEDVYEDDGSVDTSSTEPEGRCQGFAYSCSNISGYSGSCSSQDGCYLGFESDGYGGSNPVCKGNRTGCVYYNDEYDCESQRGCSWY